MTILAGIFSRRLGSAVPTTSCESLKRVISRNPSDQPVEVSRDNAYLVKVDIGAFGKPAHHVSDSGAISFLVGEPLLVRAGHEPNERDSDLRVLHADWEQGDFTSARWASGTFCAAFHDARRSTGYLVADRLGLRTLYYVVVGEMVYFASALRILEALQEVPKVLDVPALAETTGFGYPFGAGTAYAGIKMLLPCEVLSVSPEGVSSTRYFEWNAIRPIEVGEGEAIEETFRLFQSAVRRRLHGDRTSFAYLSGGLDSRCVVAALRAEGVHAYTFNFSLPKTQDQVFALEYAQKCGAVHHELPTEPGPNWSAVMAEAWQSSPHRRPRDAEHPQLVWTGEGGSVGLGHVYISPEIVCQMRSGDWDAGIDTFLRQQGKSVLMRILKPEVAAQFKRHLHARLREELLVIRQPDPVRALYIYLNMNGPRRHLVNHFETIDQHRLEFQLPFYDSELMEYLTSLPVDPCLYHGLYVKWLSRFDPSTLAVPWQAYPGHVPSPIPVPDDVPDQWNAPPSTKQQKRLRKELDERSHAMLSDPDFPARLLNKKVLWLMRLAWRWGLGNYDYALKAALVYFKYSKVAEGRFELPPR